MSRNAVANKLIQDSTLRNTLGVKEGSIVQAQGLNERPDNTGPFIMLHWLPEGSPVFGRVKPPRRLQVWAHYPVELSNDYKYVDGILDRVEDLLLEMEHVKGTDGMTVTCVRSTGRSADLKDEGLQTFTRWGAFEVLSRKESP